MDSGQGIRKHCPLAIVHYTLVYMTHHVVIVGAGFGGMYALQTFQKLLQQNDDIEITLIDKNDSFVFVPMLHEVATGLLRPDSILMPIRLFSQEHVRNVIQGSVTGVDFDKRLVSVERSEGWSDTIGYDSLILATGSATHFFDVPGAAEHAFPLRSLDDAKRIKNRIIEMFDKADEAETEAIHDSLLRFVVVGGGATGVEVAAELAECMCEELPALFPRLKDRGQVVLVNRADRLLAEADPWFSRKAEEALTRRPCMRVMHETSVEKVTPDGVETTAGPVSSQTVIWCAGVHANTVTMHTTEPLPREDWSHRIGVLPTLALEVHPEVYVVGDSALVIDPTTTKPYAMRAQFAVRQGEHAAHNILARLRGKQEQPFVWKEQGFIISLGKGKGIAKIGPFRFSGWTAWVIYHASYLRSLVGIRAKLRTLLEWSFALFGKRDFSKV